MEFLICFMLYAGFGLIIIALFLKMTMSGIDDIAAGMPSEAQEVRSEKKARFGHMDLVEQLISELDTPLDMLEGDFEYNNYLSILEPVSGMDAVRRIDEVIDKLVEIGDVRAVEPLIILAKKRETFRSESAIEALGNFDDKRSIDYLVKSLSDKDKDIRKTAADALDKLGWEP